MSSASSSVSEGETGAAPVDSLDAACSKIARRLCGPVLSPLTVRDHASATRAMLQARDLLLSGGRMSQQSRSALLCAGVSSLKRTHSGLESTEVGAQIHVTATLVFSLLVLAEEEAGGPGGSADDVGLLSAWHSRTLEQALFKDQTTSWAAALSAESQVCRAALREARRAADANAVETVGQLAAVFFRCTSAAMVEAALQQAGSSDFLNLDAAGVLDEVNEVPEERLRSIVGAAESDAGQMIMRDLVLSFRLPASVLGLRRTLLLSREATALATREFTSEVNAAHETAMGGAEAAWRGDLVQRVCALLAGLAILLAPDPESLRKGDAFAGRVALPFLECSPRQHTAPRLALLPEKHAWVVYRVSEDAKVTVRARYEGVEGLCRAVLLLLKKK